MGSPRRLPYLISGRTALIIVIVTTAAGGFTLGYFVGQRVPPSAAPSRSGQTEGDVTSSTNIRTSTVFSGNEASAPKKYAEQLSISGDKQTAASSVAVEKPSKGNNIPEQISARAGSSKPSGGPDNPASNREGVPGERRSSVSAKPDRKAGKPTLQTPRETHEDRLSDSDIALPKKSTSYTVQAGAFGHHKDAVAFKHRLDAKGYRTFIKKERNSSGRVLFKVSVGEFKTKQDAMATVRNLRKSEEIDALAIAGNQ
jgi:cell division septation protein DedD